MSLQDDKLWWIPELTDAAWCARIREDYLEDAADLDDHSIQSKYAKGLKYADTWDHLGDAREQFEKLADAYFALTAELAAAKKDAERWKYWKPRMIAADFEWGQFKEPVLVFSLNCKVSSDIDKSTDEAIAATGSNHVD
jgi:hypothetical protein